MSPSDEIRWLNLRKREGKDIGSYGRWVLGGCRGPNPRMIKTSSKKLLKRIRGCPDTKVTFEMVVRLREKVANLKDELRGLRIEHRDLRKRVRKALR